MEREAWCGWDQLVPVSGRNAHVSILGPGMKFTPGAACSCAAARRCKRHPVPACVPSLRGPAEQVHVPAGVVAAQ